MSTTNTMSAVRITKAQKLAAIRDMIPETASIVFPGDDKHTAVDFNHAEIVKFIDNEIAMLEKKNNGEKKPTKKQEENEVFKTDIVNFLSNLPADKHEATCTEMFKQIPSLNKESVQRVSALCRQLKLSGQIASKEGKGGKTLFYIA